MDCVAVFVDAGYLFAQGSTALVGHNVKRESIVLNSVQAIDRLKAFAVTQASHCRLLRIYWYDGTRLGSGQTTDQATLAHLNDVKLRLGFINSFGQQKGVDSLIVTDLVELARLKAITDAILVSGDEDVRVGVQIAQNYGVRVHLVGLYPARGSQSLQLQQEADTTTEWAKDEISTFLSIKEARSLTRVPAVQVPKADGDQAAIVAAVQEFVRQLTSTEIDGVKAYWSTARGVPADLDKRLLPTCAQAISRRLERDEIKLVRAEFQRSVTSLLGR
jgi:uncharacterized LabA/DUF88 family protein